MWFIFISLWTYVNLSLILLIGVCKQSWDWGFLGSKETWRLGIICFPATIKTLPITSWLGARLILSILPKGAIGLGINTRWITECKGAIAHTAASESCHQIIDRVLGSALTHRRINSARLTYRFRAYLDQAAIDPSMTNINPNNQPIGWDQPSFWSGVAIFELLSCSCSCMNRSELSVAVWLKVSSRFSFGKVLTRLWARAGLTIQAIARFEIVAESIKARPLFRYRIFT